VLHWLVIPCRAILASHSEYFKARVSTNWTAANIIKHEGRQVIVEQVEPDMVGQAALITGSCRGADQEAVACCCYCRKSVTPVLCR
jgi:hypothetical protein